MARKGKDKCKFIKKLWGEVTNEVANKESRIPGLKFSFAWLFATFIAIYLVYSVNGNVPEALHMNFVMLSATLGGLVFTGASLLRRGKNVETRKSLMNVAKKFVIATFFFIIFSIFFVFIKDVKGVNFDLFSLNFYKEHLVYAVFFWLAGLGMWGGSYFFARALTDFLASLRKIS